MCRAGNQAASLVRGIVVGSRAVLPASGAVSEDLVVVFHRWHFARLTECIGHATSAGSTGTCKPIKTNRANPPTTLADGAVNVKVFRMRNPYRLAVEKLWVLTQKQHDRRPPAFGTGFDLSK